jgi:hypothetical protein
MVRSLDLPSQSAAWSLTSEVAKMRNRAGWILILAGVLIPARPARSRAQDVDKDNARPNTLKAQVEESIGWYQVFADASVTEPMKPQPVLRWGNFTRGKQEADGVFVLWTNEGRPEVSVSIYPWYGYILLKQPTWCDHPGICWLCHVRRNRHRVAEKHPLWDQHLDG